MSRDDWFRNTRWDDQIALQFEAKLRRAHRKGQFLRIQACSLRGTDPLVALSLLDRYFQQEEDRIDDSLAYVDQATAFLALGRVDEAVYAYEEALKTEEKMPHTLTEAYLDLPYLISVHRMCDRYGRALELLEKHRDRLTFPVEHFMWNAAQAIIANNTGDQEKARDLAGAALKAADQDRSGFRYHPKIGLISDKHAEVLSLLRGYYNS
jgi:tetratricopeptide (TPR) repeat protein